MNRSNTELRQWTQPVARAVVALGLILARSVQAA